MEKNQNKKQPQAFMKKAAQIGLFGGLFWGAVWYFLHIFSFSNVGPNYFLMPFALGDWKKDVWGNVSGIAVMGILSIVIAMLYGALFKKFQGVIPGIIYGLFWWAVLFLGIGSLSPVLKNALEFQKETLITTICIFILYGVFIAYSVSFEASEEKLTGTAKETNYSNK
ncbi:YqhR family membrane protein [Ectobacillus panaciterrae]|uniref:YqhR family membrane protein n=1 Tax=Ectobacillus panaciterrae TaxID=363872 RepID=UPI00040CD842|nr:YqhR family membrane protein [Ectobacillus panaciterrae]